MVHNWQSSLIKPSLNIFSLLFQCSLVSYILYFCLSFSRLSSPWGWTHSYALFAAPEMQYVLQRTMQTSIKKAMICFCLLFPWYEAWNIPSIITLHTGSLDLIYIIHFDMVCLSFRCLSKASEKMYLLVSVYLSFRKCVVKLLILQGCCGRREGRKGKRWGEKMSASWGEGSSCDRPMTWTITMPTVPLWSADTYP